MAIKLTLEQRRIEAMRTHYARYGVKYDKATRRLLENLAQDESRPTVKLLPVAVNLLVLQTVEPE